MQKAGKQDAKKAADAAKGGGNDKTVKTVNKTRGDEKNFEKGRPKDTGRMGA